MTYVTYTTSSLYPHVMYWPGLGLTMMCMLYAGYVMRTRDELIVMHHLFHVRHEYDTTGKYVVPIDANSQLSPRWIYGSMRAYVHIDENLSK